jgi:hypothetical protein
MITERDLSKLGYIVKTRMSDGSMDYKHGNIDVRPYLVNLKNGSITIHHEVNKNKGIISFSDYETFKKWHEKYDN